MKDADLKARFQMIEDTLNDAYEKNDWKRISFLLADDWIILESSTGVSTKKQFLKAIQDGHLVHSTMKKEVLRVQLFDDVAIVVTRGKNVGTYLDKPFDSEQWVTNIYRMRGSAWICIMTQETPVSC